MAPNHSPERVPPEQEVVTMTEAMTLETWIGLGIAIILFWGVATWALIRTLRQEERKVQILERQDRMDDYSPKALNDLREWIENNPEDPLVEDARRRYNETVETLKSVDDRYYDWSDDEVESLETI